MAEEPIPQLKFYEEVSAQLVKGTTCTQAVVPRLWSAEELELPETKLIRMSEK
jgi:hypothetical protein